MTPIRFGTDWQDSMALLSLPFECCLQVFSFLDLRDIFSISETCKTLRAVAKDDNLWMGIATAKWGEAALALSQEAGLVGPGKWYSFCQHRMCVKSHEVSPLDLVQEKYPDPWQHLVCCLLCSRTTGGTIIRNTIVGFLEAYETPSAVLLASDRDIESDLNPVGLQAVRRKALKAMTRSFFAEGWTDPSQFHGCGSFAKESWMIFCRGWTGLSGVHDIKLRAYLRWVATGKIQAEAAAKRCAARPRKRKGAPVVVPSARTLRSGRRR